MSELNEIAGRIVQEINIKAMSSFDLKGVSVEELNSIVRLCLGHECNCYPGQPSNECFGLAIFMALGSPTITRSRRGHLSCGKAMEKIIQHLAGHCGNYTSQAIFITDHWDAVAAEEWRSNLKDIATRIKLEIYLMNGSHISLIKID